MKTKGPVRAVGLTGGMIERSAIGGHRPSSGVPGTGHVTPRWWMPVLLLMALIGFSRGECSMGTLAKPYRTLKYNSLNGYVYKNGAVRRVAYGSQSTSYNAIGCSAFVVPMLNKFIYQDEWASHQRSNWRLYQKTGSDIADAFGLPFACTLTTAQVVGPSEIKNLIAQKKLAAGQYYLFDTRRGAAGHTGFIQVMKDGSLKTFMFSGIGKGTDKTDDTLYKPAGSTKKLPARRSKLSGYTDGSFAAWYKASKYKASKVQLFRLPVVVPDTLAGEGGTVGASLGSLSGCTDTAQLAVGSKIGIRLDYDCEQRKGTATVTGEMDAYSANNGMSTLSFTWQGEMSWNGKDLTGVLVRQDRSDRPSLTLTISHDEQGNFFATTTVPYTYYLYLLDGSCTTPINTFNYSLNQIPLLVP